MYIHYEFLTNKLCKTKNLIKNKDDEEIYRLYRNSGPKNILNLSTTHFYNVICKFFQL